MKNVLLPDREQDIFLRGVWMQDIFLRGVWIV